MISLIVILTGPVCSGKTTLSKNLAIRFGSLQFRTRDGIVRRVGSGLERDRRALQELGESLDTETNGNWTCEDISDFLQKRSDGSILVIDSPRSEIQIHAIRRNFRVKIVHIHLTAALSVLERRYSSRNQDAFLELDTYNEVQKNRTEALVESLANIADIVIETDHRSEEEITLMIASMLNLDAVESVTKDQKAL